MCEDNRNLLKMGLSEHSDDHIYSKHKDLCKDLNMDLTTTAVAWDSYESIKQHYTLEVSSFWVYLI